MFKFITFITILTGMLLSPLPFQTAGAAETDVFAKVLDKVDNLACSNPEKIVNYYSPKLVIMVDDKRALLENRVKGYRRMLSEFREMKCKFQRKILAGQVGDRIGYILADELISVTSASTDTDERQHSVCSYMFSRERGTWKIAQEHCSSLPDYTIQPGEDALYYFHNPVY